jgi:hypothetical protein
MPSAWLHRRAGPSGERRLSTTRGGCERWRVTVYRGQTYCQAWIEGERGCERGILLMALVPRFTTIPTHLLAIPTAR